MCHQIGLWLKIKNQKSTYDKCISFCCHRLHINKKKIQNQIFTWHKSKAGTNNETWNGGLYSLQSFLKASFISLGCISCSLFHSCTAGLEQPWGCDIVFGSLQFNVQSSLCSFDAFGVIWTREKSQKWCAWSLTPKLSFLTKSKA